MNKINIDCKKKFDKIEKKQNIIILIVSILIIVLILKNNMESIEQMFKNTSGIFDMNIIWTAVGSIGSILAFIGVIITIVYTEKSRQKQNLYEYTSQKIMDEEIEFKHVMKEELEILDPIFFIEKTNFLNENNIEETSEQLLLYIVRITNVNFKISWYYSKEMGGYYPNLNYFISELDKFVNCMKKWNIRLSNEIRQLNVAKIDMYNGTITDKDFKKKNDEFVNNKIKILDEILQYRENEFGKLQEIAKNVVAEREEVVECNLKNK